MHFQLIEKQIGSIEKQIGLIEKLEKQHFRKNNLVFEKKKTPQSIEYNE